MIGVLSSFFLTLVILAISFLWRNNYFELVKHHLAILPQAPIIMFIQHNLGGGIKEPAWILLLPVFTSLLILSTASVTFFAKGKNVGQRLFLSPVLIGYVAYGLLCLYSASQSSKPDWSLYAILWTLPFGFIFFGAAKMLNGMPLSNSTPLTYSVLFSCFLSIAIVIFALITGRANTLLNSRSFGSILSITGILQMLILYFPLASFETRRSKLLQVLFWVLPLFAMGLSLSRSALIPIIVYLFTLQSTFKIPWKRYVLRVEFYVTALSTFILGSFLLFFTEMGGSWWLRFEQLPYAIQLRLEIFGNYWHAAKTGSPFVGVGYGLTRFFNPEGYTDLHNMLLTELFENGLGAAIVFGTILGLALFYVVYCFVKKRFLILAFALFLTILLAHFQGINLAIRNPGAYNTPYFMCVFFFVLGLLEKQVFGGHERN